MGIDDGATAFAVASVTGASTSLGPSAMALAGAGTAAALTLGLAGGAGTSGYRFVVVGLGVSAVLGAITSLLLVRAPIDAANAAFPWAVGTLNARPTTHETTLRSSADVPTPRGERWRKRLASHIGRKVRGGGRRRHDHTAARRPLLRAPPSPLGP